MDETGDNASDHLDDTELLEMERAHRHDYDRLNSQEPDRSGATHPIKGSPMLLASFDRWRTTHLAARLRGIIGR